MKRTVVFIHGAWLSPACWAGFRARYEARGHPCLAPAWPLAEGTVAELRRAPHARLAQLTIAAIVSHYEGVVRALPRAPILVGHCLGGLIVQLLLDRGLGAAGIAIAPHPPRGIRSARALLQLPRSWASWRRVLTMPPAHFAQEVAQTLGAEACAAAYTCHVVPAPGRVLFQSALGLGTGVRWRNPRRTPLLLLAGDEDRVVDPQRVRATYRRHSRSPAVTAFKSFAGRSHLLIAEPGWEEIADYALDWATDRVRATQ